MGIYPKTDFTKEGDLLVKTYNGFDGKIVKTYYQQILVIEERTNCYCCSCGDREGSDPYCRNHGYGYGERHCDVHDIGDGIGYDPETDRPFPLASVQWKRFQDQWLEDRWEQPVDLRCIGVTLHEHPCDIEEPHSHWPRAVAHGIIE